MPFHDMPPLTAPANTGISLPVQLMKATVLAESYYISSIFIVIYRLQRCLLTVARIFYHFTFPGFPFILINACKDISLVVNTGKTKYLEIGRRRGMIANEHIRIGSNSYEKWKDLNVKAL